MSRAVVRRPRAVLGAALVVLCLAGCLGPGVFGRLANGGDAPSGAESLVAARVLEEHFGHGGADAVAVYRSDRWTVDDPAFGQQLRASLAALPDGVLTGAQHYWNTGNRAFLSGDRHSAAVVLGLGGRDDSAKLASYRTVRSTAHPDGMDIGYSGKVPFYADATTLSLRSLARAEVFCLPVLFVLLWLVFGSLVAAALPLAVAAAAIVAATAVLRLLTAVMDVSVFTLNLVTMTALALAVDYALFVVARFREELGRRGVAAEALTATMASAGRTVLFSGLTIAVAVLGLTLLPFAYTRSMGVAGAATVLLAVLTSLTLLPAALAVLGHRVNAWRLPLPAALRRLVAFGQSTEPDGPWARVGGAVVRRPVRYLALTLVALTALTLPVLHARFGATDHRTLPPATAVRQATEALARDFPDLGPDRIQVVTLLSHPAGSPQGRQALTDWQHRLAALPGTTAGHVAAVSGRLAVVALTPSGSSESHTAASLVRAVRALPAPDDGAFAVGGPPAATADLLAALRERLPLTALCVGVSTFVLLTLAFGSVVVALKAILTTTLSLGAAFGVVTWIFQDGHLSRWLAFRPNDYIGALEPVIMLTLLFGLSIDYEVFLLSRVREHYSLTGDNEAAIVTGLRRSGGIITSAAALMLVVIAAFATSGILGIKEIAVGTFTGVTVDATLVRALLVPAALRLLGSVNWWTPAWFSNRVRQGRRLAATGEAGSGLPPAGAAHRPGRPWR